MCPVNMSGREKGFGESESSRLEKGNVAFDVPKPKPGKENIASWECRFEIEGQGCAPRKREQASCTATDVGRWRRQSECRERCHMVLRAFEFFKCKTRKQESETYDCGRNKIPGAIRKLPSDSGIRRKIQTQESSRPRRWWSDSGMMPVIQTQESMFLVRFWNNRQETRSRFLKFS